MISTLEEGLLEKVLLMFHVQLVSLINCLTKLK
jgi:hypothetical protein